MRNPNAFTKGKTPEGDAELAKYGDTSPKIFDTLDGLDLIYESGNPWQEIRESITHRKLNFPKGKKSLGKSGKKIYRQIKIRKALVELLKAVAERNEKFFGEMARHFASNQRDENCANPLRKFIADEKLRAEQLGKAPYTQKQIAEAFGVDLHTAKSASDDMGYKLAKGKKGRKKSTGV